MPHQRFLRTWCCEGKINILVPYLIIQTLGVFHICFPFFTPSLHSLRKPIFIKSLWKDHLFFALSIPTYPSVQLHVSNRKYFYYMPQKISYPFCP